jgi:hypothetical protein
MGLTSGPLSYFAVLTSFWLWNSNETSSLFLGCNEVDISAYRY